MNKSSGHVWMEVLLVLVVTSLILPVGMRSLHLLLEQHLRMNREDGQWVQVNRLQQELQRAWSQRRAHRFEPGTWLQVEGVEAGGGRELAALRFRIHLGDGSPGILELSRTDTGWLFRELALDGEEHRRLTFARLGKIDLEADGTEWRAGEVPGAFRFRFPELGTKELREGFAIHAYW